MVQPALEVEVRGTSSITRDPERAVLSLNVASEGPFQEVVSQEVTSTCNELHQSFIPLAAQTSTDEAGPEAAITSFSTSSLHSWSRTLLDPETKKPLPWVYHASSGFEVIFQNFETLGSVASKLFLMPHVTVNHVHWRLTGASFQDLGADSRKQAMEDAISKAKDFASVLGREIAVVGVFDEGSYTNGVTPQVELPRKKGQALSSTQSVLDGISLSPEKVVVTGRVRVKFASVE